MANTPIAVNFRNPIIEDENSEVFVTEIALTKVLGLLTELINAQLSAGDLVALDTATVAATYHHEPAANTAAVVTIATPGAGNATAVDTIEWSYDDDPANGSLTIADGGATVKKIDITQGGPGQLVFPNGLQFTENAAVTVTLAAGGGVVSGIVNVSPRVVSV